MYRITKRLKTMWLNSNIPCPPPDETSFLGLIVLRYLFKLSVSIKTVYYLRFCKFKQGDSGPLDPPLLYLQFSLVDWSFC